MTPYAHKVELFSGRFSYADRRVFFGRARLFPDRLELHGWCRGRTLHETLRLHDIEHIEWTAEGGANATLHLAGGRTVALSLRNPSAWQQRLNEHRHWGLPHAPGAIRRPLDLPLVDVVAYAGCM